MESKRENEWWMSKLKGEKKRCGMEVEEEEEGNTKSHGCLGALCKIDGGDERPHTHREHLGLQSQTSIYASPSLSLSVTFIGNNAPRRKSELIFCLLTNFVFYLFLP